ncbi:unnamed protein product [marine sediment metagenome]|uniref:Uncharacterized protein n=1 Tax=marine sediment metagenome TaxID=412755 RepID=X1M2T5_9ZZZZ
MRKSKPMDILVIGDVGFGKTEVAVRAAFEAGIKFSKELLVAITKNGYLELSILNKFLMVLSLFVRFSVAVILFL